jgi:hypothetical protein
MDIVRVRHPQTGKVSRIVSGQYVRHLQPLGFTLAEAVADEPAAVPAPVATEAPAAATQPARRQRASAAAPEQE